MDQTQQEFLAELEQLIEQVFTDLDELRLAKSDAKLRRELIDRIFRSVHSVKGSAATAGINHLSKIANGFEGLLAQMRSGDITIDDDVFHACESAAEAMSEALSLGDALEDEAAARALSERLRAAAQNAGKPAEDEQVVLENVPSEILTALSDSERTRLTNLVAEGNRLFVVAASFDLADFDAQFCQLKENLVPFGEVISTSPAVDDERPEKINFRVLYAGDTDQETLAAAARDFPGTTVSEIENVKPIVATPSPTASRANFVRADLDKLDLLISSTHSLLRTTTHALELARSQQPEDVVSLQSLTDEIRSSFSSLENELINLRVVSAGPVLQRALRAGRVAARLANKQIDFEVRGSELRLDKLVVEAIADSLIHLVRNAVDHGIETAEQRAESGKSERGTIRIEAISEGSQSRLRVVDDGRGVDPNRIAAAAVRLGIWEPGAPLDVERSLRMIFRAGFTTLDSLSDLSGRGVGLDVVETSVEQVGGELRVSSQFGGGTTFEIRLPVTFGIIPANVVVSNGHRYCIPTSQTLGIDAIDVVDGSSGANQLRQVSMRDLLGQPEEADDVVGQLHLITCQYDDVRSGAERKKTNCIGIVVDRVEGPQEVLVRNLGRHAGRWYGIAGAAELKDGTVALVLDLPRLLASQ